MKDLTTSSNSGSNGFSLRPSNMAEAMEFAGIISSSALVPKQYIGKPQDTLVAMMMGFEIGLNPIQSLQNIAVINGKPSIYGDAALALVQSHPAFGGIEESFDESTMTATCIVWRKGGSRHAQTFSQTDAKEAGLWGKAGPWTQYRKRMLQMRARGFALRDTFADALAGLIFREEAEDYPIDVTDRAEVVSRNQESRSQRSEPELLPEYPTEQFQKNLPAYCRAIETGKKTADQIISTIGSKYTVTKDQQKALRGITMTQQAPAEPAAETRGGA